MNDNNMVPETNGISVNKVMKDKLLRSTKWARYILFVFSIICSFRILIDFFDVIRALSNSFSMSDFFVASLGGLIYYLLFIYPIFKGFQFVKYTRRACLLDDQNCLERGLSALRESFSWFTVIFFIYIIFKVMASLGRNC